jgi:hypothetical protein
MVDLKEKISKAFAETAGLRRDLIDKAVREYFAISHDDEPSLSTDLDIVEQKVQSVLKRELLSSKWVSMISDGSVTDDRSVAALALTFDSIACSLKIPTPTRHPQLRAYSIGLAAAVGAVVGMIALTPLIRLTFDARDVGLVVGAPLGAFCAVAVFCSFARSRILRKFFRRFFGSEKRLTRRERQSHEEVVRTYIEQWLNWAVPVLALLCLCRALPTEESADRESAFGRIAALIYALHSTPAESLPVAADELIQEARNCGFEGLEGTPAFSSTGPGSPEVLVWSDDLQEKYVPFGHVVQGEKVQIERRPVIFNGSIVARGLVRKLRDDRQA